MKLSIFLSLIKLRYTIEYLLGRILSRISDILPHYRELARQHVVLSQITRDGEVVIAKTNGIYKIERPLQTIFLREDSSDFDVYNQIFINTEYKAVVDFILINLSIRIETIVDAGANIGLASLYFLQHFPAARIFSIEADGANFELAKKNLQPYGQAQIINVAVWNSNTTLFVKSDFRDKRFWSRSVSAVELGGDQRNSVPAVDINTFLDQYSLEMIDLFKMDIEGSEAMIFSLNTDLSFLNKIKILALEIHDEICNRELVYTMLKEKEFAIFNFNETTLCIKNYLLR